jgi:hypothetical protein
MCTDETATVTAKYAYLYFLRKQIKRVFGYSVPLRLKCFGCAGTTQSKKLLLALF